MVLGKLGRNPLHASIDQNLLNLRAKIVNANDRQLLKLFIM